VKAKPSQTIELLAVAVAAVGVVLLLPTHGSVLLLLASAASAATLPVLVWVYARIRAPRHLSAIVAAACGLAAFPAFYSMSFLVEGGPMPFQFVGLVSMLIAVGVLNLPSALAARVLPPDTLAEYPYIFAILLNGLFWAGVCGWLGHLLDRHRQRVRQSREERAS